jgi:hypothetical protein
MKQFLKNILILSAPFVVYLVLVAVVDPFNYLNISRTVDTTLKEGISQEVEPHLYRIIRFENDPKRNISLGDSRANNLARVLDSGSWANLSFGGASLKETIQTFWWLVEEYEVDTVLIAVSFSNYNKYNKRFWVEETLNIKKNAFSYAFSKYTFRSTVLLIKNSLFHQNVNLNTSRLSKTEFWENHINTVPKKYFEKYAYPDNYYTHLVSISKYCSENNIHLIFWIPPTHVDYQGKIREFNLIEEERTFKKDMSSFGEVYDYNYVNEITNDRDCFRDPVHFTNAVAISIRDEILHKKPFLAKHAKPVNSQEPKF